MTTLKTLVAGHSHADNELPLIHTSRCENLDGIKMNHSIDPQPCSVFNESLVYLFYGRPAYRSTRGTKNGEPMVLCPVCFVFKPRTVSQLTHRVYPCDSGAIARDLFNPEITSADLTSLELGSDIVAARRWVDLMFKSNSEYFFGKVVTGISFSTGGLEDRFYQLLLRPGPADYDDRKSAIEVQVKKTVSLPNQLHFVVLPNEFLEEKTIQDAIINIWNCDPVGYPTFKGDAPASYFNVVRDRVATQFKGSTRI